VGIRELFWGNRLLGKSLYLEAEAAGVRATGIGCFFDDAVHRLLGLDGLAWQSLYHFTVGGPVEDRRVQTWPPYAHRRRDPAGNPAMKPCLGGGPRRRGEPASERPREKATPALMSERHRSLRSD